MTNIAVTEYDRLNRALENAGVSKTVYTYVMPETEMMLDDLLDKDRGALHDMYREAWTQKQDTMHDDFFSTWRQWSAPVVKMAANDYPWVYTTGGASEALRELIYAYGLKSRTAGFSPVIHVFEADYEGFTAYATSAGIPVVTHIRATWRDTLSKIGATDQVYFSQPSAIDGNVWAEYDDFMKALYAAQPAAKVIVDLTYVGCIARSFTVDVSAPNILAILFSLSKPMGAYYHRIGGLLSREAYPGLFGNKWFKNLLSIKLGTAMMQKYSVHELPMRYAGLQKAALDSVNQQLGLSLQASDVYLLANGAMPAKPGDLETYLARGVGDNRFLRLCLTPTVASMVNEKISPRVKARAHERVGA